LSFGLFVAACGIGLGISAVGSARVVGGLRQLVVRTRAIEAGTESEPLSMLTRDEVGELALTFPWEPHDKTTMSLLVSFAVKI
jgi:adenylate cyclase